MKYRLRGIGYSNQKIIRGNAIIFNDGVNVEWVRSDLDKTTITLSRDVKKYKIKVNENKDIEVYQKR